MHGEKEMMESLDLEQQGKGVLMSCCTLLVR